MPTSELHFTRLDLVKTLHYQGKSIVEIVDALEEQQLLSSSISASSKYRLVQRCLRKIRKEDLDRFHVTRDASDAALSEYIGRQTVLFELAVQSRQLETARGLSKDLARAFGVPTEEAIKVDGDLLTLLRAATNTNRERRKAQELASSPREDGNVIDITPSRNGSAHS